MTDQNKNKPEEFLTEQSSLFDLDELGAPETKAEEKLYVFTDGLKNEKRDTEKLDIDLSTLQNSRDLHAIYQALRHLTNASFKSIEGLKYTHRVARIKAGIHDVSQLANYSEEELLAIPGIGPRAIKYIKDSGIVLRKD